MVAHQWSWDSWFMFVHFGWEVVIGIVLATFVYRFIFRKSLRALDEEEKLNPIEESVSNIPKRIIVVHLLFLLWTVVNAHSVPLLIGAFLFFLAFLQTTADYQKAFCIKSSLMVGFFLAGIVIHGGLQTWWIRPFLTALSENCLFFGALMLSAFNDNAAITYLSSLVDAFSNNFVLQKAIVTGGIVGGGLTVIANAPNPAGQSILAKHFKDGTVSPIGLLLAAILPTFILGLLLRILPL
jgi:hypothetical protein